MQVRVINKASVTDISDQLLLPNGKMILHPASFYDSVRFEDLRYFCHKHARYGIPTLESVAFIDRVINNRTAIEIGAGHGDTGYHLGIKMTDSKIQSDPKVRAHYESMQQPVIQYPGDVEKIDALAAVLKYRPKVVVASWITTFSKNYTPLFNSSPFGIRERSILSKVDTFILIGAVEVHGNKPIMQVAHQEVSADWLVSRKERTENRIWIWNKGER